MNPRILFLINGLGLGNSTRCHAVIERLHERGCEIDVLTSGNGLWYFDRCPEVSMLDELGAYSYGSSDGRLSIVRTARAVRTLLRTHKENHAKVLWTLRHRMPDVLVLDSMYNVRAAQKLGIPVVAVNNSDITVASYVGARRNPPSTIAQFSFVELPDFLFHATIPDLVISPAIDPSSSGACGRTHRVHPIVRRDFEGCVRTGPPTRAVVMLSGSSLGMDVQPNHRHFPVKVDVLGRNTVAEDPRREDLVFHGRTVDSLAVLAGADLAVINGGFSSVSELVCLRIPMIVVPVPHHAEQWRNAKTVEHFGLGRIASESTWETAMREMLGDIERYRAAARRISYPKPGAVQAADAILELVSSTMSRRNLTRPNVSTERWPSVGRVARTRPRIFRSYSSLATKLEVTS